VLIDSEESEAPQRGIYCVFLFREDMTGVYITLNQGVTKLRQEVGSLEARRQLQELARQIRQIIPDLKQRGFALDDQIDLRSEGLGAQYEPSTIAYKLYEAGHVPEDPEIAQDVEVLLEAYAKALQRRLPRVDSPPSHESPNEFDRPSALQELLQAIESAGFVYEPWQIASYVTALRTKPFVIVAGVTGTGKSKLPTVVARFTGGRSDVIPVRPDWTDSADVLGYVDLQGVFRPGRLLQVVKTATVEQSHHWTFVIDELNLARVEQYFAEVLSCIEDRHPAPTGGFTTRPLLTLQLKQEDQAWSELALPPNLAIVGTVNMDETTHGFSRKVLDRAFTLELSDIDLTRWIAATSTPAVTSWPVAAWYPRAISLAGLPPLTPLETDAIEKVIALLTTVNGFLQQAQLHVGYRTRDEIALYVLHATDVESAFVTRAGDKVDPIDLTLHMKILPRLVGGSAAVRRAVLQLLGWAGPGKPLAAEEEARAVLDEWIDLGRPGDLPGSQFPRTAARLCIMWKRLLAEGYTSYWL
jgi:5-methylcytosine-specific restriction enzyme B